MRVLLTAVILAAGAAAAQPSLAADAAAGETKFKQLCATCHGPTGKGDGPASAALNPQPRDLSDAEWQNAVDDAHIRTVIKDGGAAVGLSPIMTAFGHSLNDEDLDNLVAYIRSLDD
ncbi:c-type cytochrome [Wenzhouxiangella sediminis]|jgi:cytochrome c553|uniref:Cytochrome c n=1 Tax=Wenzhouxiangella sediminis TaxID=1792836 RepID=A0A3E1KD29_9GAMM|nr:cytochrome c [Wenzhouxiangella sediminis]RFF33019.1 cytochrome c [Wenzhouxiangella sediminis]